MTPIRNSLRMKKNLCNPFGESVQSRERKVFFQSSLKDRLTEFSMSVIFPFNKGRFMARSPITRNGYNNLHKELENLKKVVRPQVIKAIEEARAQGDLNENAEYVAAKERQSFVEKKIYEIEQKLANSEIMDTLSLSNGQVGFGAIVTLENLSNGGKVTYKIVGPDESDISSGRISIASPLGKALIGREVNDEVIVQTPGGAKNYTVLKIGY
jgi:transcription elongation factor GreA